MIDWIKNLFTPIPQRPKYILKEKPFERCNAWTGRYEADVQYVIYYWNNDAKKYRLVDIFMLKKVAEARIKHLEELENQ